MSQKIGSAPHLQTFSSPTEPDTPLPASKASSAAALAKALDDVGEALSPAVERLTAAASESALGRSLSHLRGRAEAGLDAIAKNEGPIIHREFDRALVEATCLVFPCEQALGIGKGKMPDGGLAEKMVDHFRSGQTSAVAVDLNRELERNPQLKEFLASRIENELAERLAKGETVEDMQGAVWVSQGTYGDTAAGEDQRKSLGGTYFEYQVAGTADDGGLQLQLNVSDHYFWSPADPRPTQCLHVCAAEMVTAGRATEFYQHGEGQLVVNDPRTSPPMPLFDPPPTENL